jgi:hypothetical protein
MQNSELMGKDENIAFRTSLETKQLLERLAKEGYRSLSQQCEMIVLDWLRQQGYMELEEREPFYRRPAGKKEPAVAMVQEPQVRYGKKGKK